MDYSTSTLWTGPFPVCGVSGWFLYSSCNVETSEFNANSADPDQMPHSVASDLGLHCLPMSLLWNATLKWVNTTYFVLHLVLSVALSQLYHTVVTLATTQPDHIYKKEIMNRYNGKNL